MDKPKYQRVNAELSYKDSEGNKHVVTSNLKPREFWILEYPGAFGLGSYSVEEKDGPYQSMFCNGALNNYYHVIEHSAFEQLQRENEELRAKFAEMKVEFDKTIKPFAHGGDYNIVPALKMELADLKKQLSEARHHLDTLIHDCKRYEEVEKENIAICKIKPALNRAREALNPTDKKEV